MRVSIWTDRKKVLSVLFLTLSYMNANGMSYLMDGAAAHQLQRPLFYVPVGGLAWDFFYDYLDRNRHSVRFLCSFTNSYTNASKVIEISKFILLLYIAAFRAKTMYLQLWSCYFILFFLVLFFGVCISWSYLIWFDGECRLFRSKYDFSCETRRGSTALFSSWLLDFTLVNHIPSGPTANMRYWLLNNQ